MNKLILLLLIPFASFAQTADKEFKIKGSLKLAKPIDWIYLRYAADGQLVTDSLQSSNGDFKFEGKIAEPLAATLVVKYVKQPDEERAKSEYVQIFIEPTKMEITAKDSLKANTVTGSSGHTDFANLLKQQQPYSPRLNKLYEDYTKFRKEEQKDSMKLTETEIEAV